VPYAVENQCWNRVALHHLTYYSMRHQTQLGSQMVCNAIKAVCDAYKALRKRKRNFITSTIKFKIAKSVHFDKLTYSLKDDVLSLYTLDGRIRIKIRTGQFQQGYLSSGAPKEGELICRNERWYFNLVLDCPKPIPSKKKEMLAVDLGENNVAAMSSGKIFKGGSIRHERDKFLSLRRRLQSNGSRSAKQLLKKISGKESRRIKHINHKVSKEIVKEAVSVDAGTIVLEDLTNIRERIKARKRERIRLHRWSFAQLQVFVQYKAEAHGLRVIYVNPAYSSQLCSLCGNLGSRIKHRFTCFCRSRQHSDLNASRNLCRLALSADGVTCAVSRTHVAPSRRL